MNLAGAVRVAKFRLVRCCRKILYSSRFVGPLLFGTLGYFDTDAALGQQLIIKNDMAISQL